MVSYTGAKGHFLRLLLHQFAPTPLPILESKRTIKPVPLHDGDEEAHNTPVDVNGQAAVNEVASDLDGGRPVNIVGQRAAS